MKPPVVFAGPSLPRAAIRAELPDARIEPPIARGDLDRHLGQGARTLLVLDGVFAHRLAVAPSEIVAAIGQGARIVGAASMGAIRAAECSPAGMVGVGAVHRLYRLKVLRDDDEVAVATDPEREFTAVSVALVNVRYAVLRALQAGLLDRPGAGALLSAAKRAHFAERTWEAIFGAAMAEPAPELQHLCETTDIKRVDAELALRRLAEAAPLPAPAAAARLRARAAPAERYPSHDPDLGRPRAQVRRELVSWLIASGRYRRYVTDGAAASAAGTLDETLWTAVERERAVGFELMRRHAVTRGLAMAGADAASVPDVALTAARREIAAEHGYSGWSDLERDVRGGLVAGAVPVAAVEQACRSLARASLNL